MKNTKNKNAPPPPSPGLLIRREKTTKKHHHHYHRCHRHHHHYHQYRHHQHRHHHHGCNNKIVMVAPNFVQRARSKSASYSARVSHLKTVSLRAGGGGGVRQPHRRSTNISRLLPVQATFPYSPCLQYYRIILTASQL